MSSRLLPYHTSNRYYFAKLNLTYTKPLTLSFSFFFPFFFFSLLHSHILSQLFYTSQNIIKSYNTLTHSLTTSWKTYVPSTNYCTSLIILTHYHDSFFLLDTLFFFFIQPHFKKETNFNYEMVRQEPLYSKRKTTTTKNKQIAIHTKIQTAMLKPNLLPKLNK